MWGVYLHESPCYLAFPFLICFFTKSLVIFSTVNSVSFFFAPPFLSSGPFSSSPPQFSRLALSLSLYPFPFSHVNVCLQNLFPYCYNGNPPKLYRSRDRMDKSFLSLFCPLLAPPFTTPVSYFFVYYRMRKKILLPVGNTFRYPSHFRVLLPFHCLDPLCYMG